MTKRIIPRGDPVEVKFGGHDGPIWLPATVTECTEEKLSVSYADGHRQVIRNVYNQTYRIPEWAKNGRSDRML